MSRFNIFHETIINKPVEEVWKELIAIDDWEWNKWTKLKADSPAAEGVKGKLLASYNGDEEWEKFDFRFGRVDESEHLLTWIGGVGPKDILFSGYHTMQLVKISEERTTLIHEEKFGGLLPALGLGLPYKTLDRNYLLMNKALKNCVEESD
eukprot:CAMPEP_0201690302 /NCGR_PEP_ID=MMETSP0578-20130828/3768_1 /ASSEMBLY_ACC=CAM_ASM_000663 /TAXON_ID=267565 /ORGANISM="Skeletonema grethea, Strain CCMP 1804" /LENGTH=150 /DNA_ID=CAMNT_0048175247 /DNA_START=116 /DNA_END=568 /DNA_ORIENTATION=-